MPIIGGIAVVVFPALAWAVGELAWFEKMRAPVVWDYDFEKFEQGPQSR